MKCPNIRKDVVGNNFCKFLVFQDVRKRGFWCQIKKTSRFCNLSLHATTTQKKDLRHTCLWRNHLFIGVNLSHPSQGQKGFKNSQCSKKQNKNRPNQSFLHSLLTLVRWDLTRSYATLRPKKKKRRRSERGGGGCSTEMIKNNSLYSKPRSLLLLKHYSSTRTFSER